MMQVIKERHERVLDGIRRLESQLAFRLAIMQRMLERQMTRLLDRHGISLAAYRVLVTIEAFDEIAAADLVRLVVVDKGLISRTCQDLVTAGLIASRPDPRNARRKLLRLSDAGMVTLARLGPDVEARNAGLDGQLDQEERRTLDSALAKLTRHLADDLGQDMPLHAAAAQGGRASS